MYPWIEFTSDNGSPVLVNISRIVCVSNYTSGCRLELNSDAILVKESYEKVKQMIADAYAESCTVEITGDVRWQS